MTKILNMYSPNTSDTFTGAGGEKMLQETSRQEKRKWAIRSLKPDQSVTMATDYNSNNSDTAPQNLRSVRFQLPRKWGSVALKQRSRKQQRQRKKYTMCSCTILLPQQGRPVDLFSPDRWQLILAASSRQGGYTLDITGWAYKTQLTVAVNACLWTVEGSRRSWSHPAFHPSTGQLNAGQPVPSQAQESDFSWTPATGGVPSC